MKNLKMFAISLLAFLVMATGVHATGDGCTMPDDDNAGTCTVTLNGDGYRSFGAAWDAAYQNGGTIKLLKEITGGNFGALSKGDIEGSIIVDLDGYKLDLSNTSLSVKANASLKFTGAGEVTTRTLTVANNGTLEVDGNVKLIGKSTSGNTLISTKGIVKINGGAELSAGTTIVDVTAATANVTLNAKVGTRQAPSAAKLIGLSTYAAPAQVGGSNATVTIEGGEYYISDRVLEITKPINVVINNGTLYSTAKAVIYMNTGNVTINNGTLTAAHNTIGAGVFTDTGDEGALTINGGTIASKGYYAVNLLSGKIIPKITNGTFNSGKLNGKQLPAIFITSSLLTGLNNDPEEDVFKSILTGGRYLSAIIGDRANGDATQSAATVQNYVVAEGATVTEDGNYKVINAKVDDPNTGDGTQTAPEETTNPDVPNVPKTNDNILVYASLGLVSALTVGFSAKRKENN